MMTPETAPKDELILAAVGLPFLVVAHWNEHEKAWVYASLNANMINGEFCDIYFENEYEKEIYGWLPVPAKG